MNYKKIFIFFCLIFFLHACDPVPYQPPAYQVNAYVVGEEICKADSNYNYWLLNVSSQNNLPYKGDTIVYNGVKYTNVFKTISLNNSLRHPGKNVSIKFNYASQDYQKSQSSNCDAANAETFALTDIILFQQSEIR